MVSRAIVSRFITRRPEEGRPVDGIPLAEEETAESEHDPGASRRQLLRQLGVLGLAVGGTALDPLAVGAKGRQAAKRNNDRKSKKHKERQHSPTQAENNVGEVTPALEETEVLEGSTTLAEGQSGQVTPSAIIPSPGPTSGARQWKITTANGASPRPGIAFSLYNNRNRSYLRYDSRWFGINLGWTSTASRTFTVRRSSSTTTAIKYGELVALRNATGGYIKYGARDWGINLVWSSTPIYQWRVQGGTTGAVVPNNAVVTLYNTVSPRPKFPPWCGKPGAAVVYGWRPVGINLVWNPPGFWVPSLSIPGVPNWADSWLRKIAIAGATYLGIPVAQYQASVKTLCALSSLDAAAAESESSEQFAEDAGYASIDAATLSSAAEDKRAAGDAVTDEHPDDLGLDDGEVQEPADGASTNGKHRNAKKRGNGRNRNARRQRNGRRRQR